MSHVSHDQKPAVASRTRRRSKVGMVLTAGVVIGSSMVALEAPGGAAARPATRPAAEPAAKPPLPKSLAMFAHCPVSVKSVTSCLYASQGGTFQVGKADLTFPRPAILTLGLANTSSGGVVAVAPTDGTPILDAPTVNIPELGGLVDVGATASIAGLPKISVPNLLTAHGVAAVLPLVVQLSNPVLGSSCTLGTTSAPLTLRATDGKTDPPAPNTPVTGSKGTLSSTNAGVLTAKGVKLVDNAFAAPGASGCGPLGLEDPVVDELEGLPAAAGTNSAALNGNVYTAPAYLIRKYTLPS